MRIGRRIRLKRSPGRALLHRWPFLLACLVLGTLLAGAVLLARPPAYEARVTVHFDPERYDFAVRGEGDGLAVHPLLVREAEDLLALEWPADLHSSTRIGRPVEFRADPLCQGRCVVVFGRATAAGRAQEIAVHGAEALQGAMHNIYGWDLLRTLLRRAIYLQGQGRPEPPSLLTPHLFDLLEGGFLQYDPSIPVSQEAPTLTNLDVIEMSRAVQRMADHYEAQINALFEQQARTQDPAEQARIEEQKAALIWKQQLLRRALQTLYRERGTLIEAEVPMEGLPEYEVPNTPAERIGPPRWPFLFVGTGAGLLLGGILALFDEEFGLVERLREVVAYRDLIWNLVLRDLKARYKSSILGYLWSLVNPLLMMAVFTVLFKFLLKSEIPNFPVFIIVALLPWNFCATSVSGAVVSITGQSSLIKKVYFPREAIPIAVVIANLINFLLALPAMILIMLLLNAHFQPVALLFPVIALVETIFLLGVALFLSCLNVFFRDTQVIMDVLLTAWFFLTPIFYRLGDIVDERLARLVRWLNPMASLVDFYRDIFYLGGMPGWDAMIRTFVTALLVLLVGYLVFLRFSPRFGEEV